MSTTFIDFTETLEIDTRPVPGNGGSVAWLLYGDEHRILVRDEDGEFLSVRTFADGGEARDAFYHPFASAAVELPVAFAR